MGVCVPGGHPVSSSLLHACGSACLSFGSRKEGGKGEPLEDLQASGSSAREPLR